MLASRLLRPRTTRLLAVALLGLLLGFLVMLPEIVALPMTPHGDGRYVFHQIAIGKAAILRYRELPLWNPWDCRGIPMWDHPEAVTASPLLLLLTPLPTGITYAIWELLHVAIGFSSMWYFAKDDLRLSRTGSAVASAVFAFSVAHVMQCMGAHSTFLTFYLAPLLLYLWRRAERSRWSAVALGLTLVFMLLEGATYPLPLCAVMLFVETLTRLTSPRRLFAIARAGVIVVVVTLGVGAFRLFPLVDQLRQFVRPLPQETDALETLSTLGAVFTLKQPLWYTRLTEPHEYTWHEYNVYIGWSGVVLALLGLVVALRRRPGMVVVAVAMFVLMMGHFAPWAPWTFLREHVPLFKGMRVPSRFRLLLMVYVAAFIGLAADGLPDAARRIAPRFAPYVRAFVVGMGLLTAGEMYGLVTDIVALRYVDPPVLAKVKASPTFYYEGPGLVEFLDQPRQNRAWLGCRSYEWKSYRDAPLWVGDVPQAKIVSGTARLVSVERTNNTFSALVETNGAVRVAFNSAYERGWRTSAGALVEHQQLLAVDLPEGRHRVKLEYWPRAMTPSILVTTGSVFVLGLAALRTLRARRRARGITKEAR